MKLLGFTNTDVAEFIENTTAVFKNRVYKSKQFIADYLGLAITRAYFYGVKTSDGQYIPYELVNTRFVNANNVTLTIEGVVVLPEIPSVTGGGSIVYQGYGLLEVNGVVIYDGRNNNSNIDLQTLIDAAGETLDFGPRELDFTGTGGNESSINGDSLYNPQVSTQQVVIDPPNNNPGGGHFALTPQTLMVTAEANKVEYDGAYLWLTNGVSSLRQRFAYAGESSGGSNFSQIVYCDSKNGNDTGATGQTDKMFQTIQGVLAKVDDGTIVTSIAITGDTTASSTTISSVSSTAACYKGQRITGNGIPYNTQIVSFTSNTIVLSKPATITASTVTITLRENVEVVCNGYFDVSGVNIARMGVTFSTTSKSILTSSSGIIIAYDISYYPVPCQTLKGNWQVLLSGTAQLRVEDFTTDIGFYYGYSTVAQSEVVNFYDEFDKLFSTVAGGVNGTTSAIAHNHHSQLNRVVSKIKYSSIVCDNSLVFYSDMGSYSTFIVEQDTTFGRLGCFYIAGGNYQTFIISKGIVWCPYNTGAYTFYSQATYNYQAESYQIYANSFLGNVSLSCRGVFHGDIYGYDIYLGLVSNNGYTTGFLMVGEVEAINIFYIRGGSFDGNIRAPITNANVANCDITINGNYVGAIYNTNMSTLTINGKSMAGFDNSNYKYCTNGRTIVNGDCANANYSLFDIAGGDVVLNCKMIDSGHRAIALSAGSLLTGTECVITNDASDGCINQSGGSWIHKGKLKQTTNGNPCFTKSGGKMQIDGGSFVVSDTATQPAKMTVNSSPAKDINLIISSTNCDGVTTSLKNAFPANYAPNLIGLGGLLVENNNFV